MFSQTQSESENKEETMQIIDFRQWKTESDEEEIKQLKKARDYYKEREEILNNALDKKDEEIKKLDEENTKLLSENEEAKDHIEADKETIIELEDKVKTLELKIKALEYQNTEKHQQWQYENMKKDRQHFIDLNNERWDELQKMKKAEQSYIDRIEKLNEKNEEIKNHSWVLFCENSKMKEAIKTLKNIIE
jgi:chromosome segregation ATPase